MRYSFQNEIHLQERKFYTKLNREQLHLQQKQLSPDVSNLPPEDVKAKTSNANFRTYIKTWFGNKQICRIRKFERESILYLGIYLPVLNILGNAYRICDFLIQRDPSNFIQIFTFNFWFIPCVIVQRSKYLLLFLLF